MLNYLKEIEKWKIAALETTLAHIRNNPGTQLLRDHHTGKTKICKERLMDVLRENGLSLPYIRDFHY